MYLCMYVCVVCLSVYVCVFVCISVCTSMYVQILLIGLIPAPCCTHIFLFDLSAVPLSLLFASCRRAQKGKNDGAVSPIVNSKIGKLDSPSFS